VTVGIEKNSENFPDLEEESQQRDEAEGIVLINDLRDFDRTGLTIDQKLDLDLAIFLLNQETFQSELLINGEISTSRAPDLAIEISDALFTLFVNDSRDPSVRLDIILQRIQKTPDHIADSIGYLDHPIKRWVENEILLLNDLPDFYSNIVGWADSCNYSKTSELIQAVDQANKSIKSYVKQLKSIPTSTNFSLGDEQTRALIKANGIEMSPEQIKELAVTFLKKNGDDVEFLRSKLCKKYELSEETSALRLQSFLNEKFKLEVTDNDLSSVLDYYKAEKEKMVQFIENKGVFPVIPQNDFLIMKTPKIMEPTVPAGALMPPLRFRSEPLTSIVYLTLDADDMCEHTKLSIPMMIAHEGIGHHKAYATAYSNSSIVRKHCDYLDVAEGWSTYIERYMIDQGYMGSLTDEANFITTLNFNRIGARALIDLYFMTGNIDYLNVGLVQNLNSSDPFKNAKKFLRELTGFSSDMAEAEVDEYSQSQVTTLSYLVGNYLVNELKSDVAKKTGLTGLELDQTFHKNFLEYATIPVSFIRKVFKDKGLVY
jgi:hypothetical protein